MFANVFTNIICFSFKFIGIICNGDIEKMLETVSELTWYEEWLAFFEYQWGRTNSRFDDLAALYKCSKKETMYRIFDQKLYFVLVSRTSWPVYVTFEEDKELRDPKWNGKYDGLRIITWDDTNVCFNFKPSGAMKFVQKYISLRLQV